MSVKYVNDTGAARLADHLKLKKLTGILYGGESWEPIEDSGSTEPSYYSQIAEVEGLGANDIVIVQHDSAQMTLSDIETMEKDKIRCLGQDDEELVFIAEKLPTFDIPLIIVKQGMDYVAPPEIVSFATGTDAQIKRMLDAYYNDEITWAEMGWSVGDTRTIHFNAMTAPNPISQYTWAAQDIVARIVDHDHNDLATPINGHTKACITVHARECLNNNSTDYSDLIGPAVGHMWIDGSTSTDDVFTKWSNLYMRTYLNSTVLDAIPSGDFKSAIKPSVHYRHTDYNTTEAELVIDTLFVPSVPEMFGSVGASYVVTSPVEGTQLAYYVNNSNRIKYGNNNGLSNNVAQIYWTGSPTTGTYRGYHWATVYTNGVMGDSNGLVATALAPAWCM